MKVEVVLGGGEKPTIHVMHICNNCTFKVEAKLTGRFTGKYAPDGSPRFSFTADVETQIYISSLYRQHLGPWSRVIRELTDS